MAKKNTFLKKRAPKIQSKFLSREMKLGNYLGGQITVQSQQ